MNETNMNSTLQALIGSEHDYFNAGSHNRSILSGEMSVTPKFESLASGCILHRIQPNIINKNFENWLSDVEIEFRKIGAPLCRFYFSQQSVVQNKILIDRGYEKVTEVGLAVSLDSFKSINTLKGELKLILDEKGWELKKALYKAAKLGPDGHDMKEGTYSDFEKVKCNAGYMISYLYWKDGKLIGVVSLATKDKFSRLKNLLVHPEYRGLGIGSEIVMALMKEAKSLGSTTFGVYAVENMNSHKLYKSCGMREVLQHTEWSKELK